MNLIQKIKKQIVYRLGLLRSKKKDFEFRHEFGKNNQSGRSILEMLGVLAVMGVLTVGALVGYNYAMKIYRVNEIVEEMNRQSVLASSAKSIGVDLPENEWNTSAAGFEIEYSPIYEEDGVKYDNFFTITIKNVPDELLEMLIKKDGGKAYQILIDNVPIDEYDFKNYRRKEQSFLNHFSVVRTAHAGVGHALTFIFCFFCEDTPVPSDSPCFDDEGHRVAPDRTYCRNDRVWVQCPEGDYGVIGSQVTETCDMHGSHCVEDGGAHCECNDPDLTCDTGSTRCVSENTIERCHSYKGCYYYTPATCPKGCCEGNCCPLTSGGGCCEDGSCKPEPPDCCPEEKVAGCCQGAANFEQCLCEAEGRGEWCSDCRGSK